MAFLPYLVNYPPYAQVLPRITGSLSLAGSLFIAYHVIYKKKLAKVHHRVLLGMSVADIVSSFCTILGRIPAVHNDAVFPGYGNVGLCTAQGFFYQTILSVIAYNFSLALYYVLLVCYNWKESRLRQAEIVMHVLSVSVFLISATTLTSLSMFNPDYFLCFINSSPPGCVSDCERGSHPSTYRWLFFYGPAWGMIGLITILMAVLYWTVRQQEQRMDRFVFAGATNQQQQQLSGTTTTTATTQQQHQNRHENSRRVAAQGLWYTVPFYLTWVFPLTAHALGPTWIGAKGQPLLILVAIFLPLQGLMNAIVYVRPMVLERMQQAKLSRGRTTTAAATGLSTASSSHQHPLPVAKSPFDLNNKHSSVPPHAQRRDSFHV